MSASGNFLFFGERLHFQPACMYQAAYLVHQYQPQARKSSTIRVGYYSTAVHGALPAAWTSVAGLRGAKTVTGSSIVAKDGGQT